MVRLYNGWIAEGGFADVRPTTTDGQFDRPGKMDRLNGSAEVIRSHS